ncbi:hypothetical protein LMH73_009290 [Vibrio splendidus]|nr:hypothetical protein [Vibrio splendidus]MCC4881851.1 hypothetical protein [Vibrio splendidus]
MSKLFVCEKHSQAQSFQFLLKEGDGIILCPSISSYKFKNASTLSFSGLPYSDLEPEYTNTSSIEQASEQRESMYSRFFTADTYIDHPVLSAFYHAKIKTANPFSTAVAYSDFCDFLNEFDEIVYACDPDHTGVRGFDFLFGKYYGIKELAHFATQYHMTITACMLTGGISSKCISKAVENRSCFFESTDIQRMRDTYLKKDFFDYNYNMNSILLLNKAYHITCGQFPNPVLTRNYIQTLFLIHEYSADINRVLHRMDQADIGTPASRNKIIINLTINGLVCESEGCYITTERGNSFILALHRKMNDPHLSERLMHDYTELTVNEFKAKYSKYLSSAFGKQKRHINKVQ